MNNYMKPTFIRLSVLLLALFTTVPSTAQYATRFFATEISNPQAREAINQSLSAILTEFNNAQGNIRTPELDSLSISTDAKNDLLKLWKDCPFRCADTEIVETISQSANGDYQVRNIPLIMMPIEGESKDISWKRYQEGVFTLNSRGVITGFHLAIDASLYIKVMGSAAAVEDFVQRQLILEYVERFRNSYNLKDIDFLQQIFSDDALIITGKVITTVKSDISRMSSNNKKVVYSKQTKKEYLTKLERIFQANKHINVLFDDIKVMRHPAKPNFYGVTLKQGYSSDYYSDEGYLFLLWDFSNPDAPQIHVRTWQPDKIGDVAMPEEEIFSINDFDI